MSVTYHVEGERSDFERPETFVNMHIGNAADVAEWLGLDEWRYGEIEASELAARCRRRLWPEARNQDPGVEGSESGRVITGGRRAGYLPEKAAELLALCERAGDKRIVWG